MTLAVPGTATNSPSSTQAMPIVILGTDALLAALPATPVQLAHACLHAGFASVVPASWGDELIAAAVLRRLGDHGASPVIQCSCPIVAHRLLSVSGDLRPVMVPLVAPPAALARYLRATSVNVRPRITYVGACPGAIDDAIDIRMSPEALLAMLAERDIVLEEQPRVFESVIPADRRRFRSQPGGLPAADALWTEQGARSLVEIDGDDIAAEIVQHVLSGKNVLVDASARLGCVCSGATAGVRPREARPNVIMLEPPRAMTPVVDEHASIDLDLAIPAAPRSPIDVGAVPPARVPQPVVHRTSDPPRPIGGRFSPPRSLPSIPETRQSRPTVVLGPRAVLGAAPVTRDVEGRSLPRAYVARRRLSPKGLTAIATRADEEETLKPAAHPGRAADALPASSEPAAIVRTPDESIGELRLSRRLIAMIAAGLVLVLLASTIVGVVVGRALAR